MAEHDIMLHDIRKSLIEGEAPQLKELVQSALNNGVEAEIILNKGLISGMETLGQKFEQKEAYVPDLLLAARAMTGVMGILRPHLVKKSDSLSARVVLGTVQGDIHNIGKDLVGIMLRGYGFEVKDLGVDVAPEQFVEAAREGAQLICMSSLLVTSAPFMKTTIEALHEAGLGDITTMVGGATVTQAFAKSIGASGYAPNAAVASKAKELLHKT